MSVQQETTGGAGVEQSPEQRALEALMNAHRLLGHESAALTAMEARGAKSGDLAATLRRKQTALADTDRAL
ncbi:hypothetical protein [Kitasatospora griseola]|uniref:hypothetical protein n=1 Tax=Kitasatospora griseola TaxID=2064 RepID=UPI00381135DA